MVSPIVVLAALTMLLALFGLLTTPGAAYVGGGIALLVLFVFILTPVCAVLHLVGLVAVVRRRSTRGIWVFTGAYLALAWIACLLGPEAVRTRDDILKGRSMRPFYLFLAIPTAATLGAAVIHARPKARTQQRDGMSRHE